MVIMTQSLEHFLFRYHREEMVLIMFGHIELFTQEMQEEYAKWCRTKEGSSYLRGGANYDPEHKGNKASAEAYAEICRRRDDAQ